MKIKIAKKITCLDVCYTAIIHRVVGALLSTIFALLATNTSSAEIHKDIGSIQPSYEERNVHQEDRNYFAHKVYMAEKNSSDYSPKYSPVCFITAAKKGVLSVDVTVFSTYKVNHCDPYLYAKLDAASAKKQLKSVTVFDFVVLDGPHLQMMDRNLSSIEQKFYSVGYLSYSISAHGKKNIFSILDQPFSSLMESLGGETVYKPFPLVADVYYVWYPGSFVYKIITDDGRVFIMTHIGVSSRIYTAQDVENFASHMGDYITLPKGWRYEMQQLTKILMEKQFSFSKIPRARIQDNFGNIYIESHQEIK